MRWWLFLFALMMWAGPAFALDIHHTGAVCTTKSVTDSNASTLMVASIRNNVQVTIRSTAAGEICCGPIDAAAGLTDPVNAATCFAPPGNGTVGWEWPVREYGWDGPIYCILKSGSTDVTASVCSW